MLNVYACTCVLVHLCTCVLLYLCILEFEFVCINDGQFEFVGINDGQCLVTGDHGQSLETICLYFTISSTSTSTSIFCLCNFGVKGLLSEVCYQRLST